MLKIIGLIIIFGSSVLTGLYFSNKSGFRIKDLTAMKKALAILKSEIEFAATPLPEAAMRISQQLSSPLKELFADFSERLTDYDSVYEPWELSLKAASRLTYFQKEDTDCLLSFGQTLGYLDRQMQLQNIELVISYIDEKIDELTAARRKNQRMYGSLGVLGGLMLVILFI